MQLELDSVLDGKVIGLTKYGAFVEITGGQKGMVHISEISKEFVQNIEDYLEKGQEVKVKVINITDDGKIGLSIKQVEGVVCESKVKKKKTAEQKKENKAKVKEKPQKMTRPTTFSDETMEVVSGGNFEDMMSKFKQLSDDKISDLKKSTESKHGGFSRRNNSRYK